MVTLKLQNNDFATLLKAAKNAFEEEYDYLCENDDSPNDLIAYYELLDSLRQAFNDDEALLKYDTILSGYKRQLNEFN